MASSIGFSVHQLTLLSDLYGTRSYTQILMAPLSIITPRNATKAIRRRVSLASVLSWGYLALVILLMVTIRSLGDRTWQGTVLLFGPRWVALLPLVVLVPLVIWLRPRLLIVLGLSLLLVLFPLMGCNIGWAKLIPFQPSGMPLRILAFNLHYEQMKDPAAIRFLEETNPDIAALEEVPPEVLPRMFPPANWHESQVGELAIASRYPIVSAIALPDYSAVRCCVKTPKGPVYVIVVHLSSPHFALRDTLLGTKQGIEKLATNISSRAQEVRVLSEIAAADNRPLIIAGDFNLAEDSPLYSGKFPLMNDCFEATGFGLGWTYYNHWTALRIDRVLGNRFFAPTGFGIGPNLNSPHHPVIADVILKSHP